MVDTVWLTTSNFGLLEKSRLETIQHIKSTGACSAKQVCNISSNKDEEFKAALQQQSLPAEGNITVHDLYGAPLCMFNVSLPKLLYGHSLAEVAPADFDTCAAGIQKQLQFAGIDIDRHDIESMTVSRIDYCHNIPIEHNISEYLYMLGACTLPHAEKVPQRQGTVLFRNNSWQYTVYDKAGEILQDTKQRIAAGMTKDTPHNVLRFEYRIMRGANVGRILKRRTFKECYDLSTSRRTLLDKFDKLHLDTDRHEVINNSGLAQLFATQSHAEVKNNIAMPAILLMVNFDLDLLESYLLARYSKKQAGNIREEYKAYLYKAMVPAHRDLWQEMRSKLAA